MPCDFFWQNLTLEKIEELFSQPWSRRVNVLYYLRCACFLELVSAAKRGGSKRILVHQVQEDEDDTFELESSSSL